MYSKRKKKTMSVSSYFDNTGEPRYASIIIILLLFFTTSVYLGMFTAVNNVDEDEVKWSRTNWKTVIASCGVVSGLCLLAAFSLSGRRRVALGEPGPRPVARVKDKHGRNVKVFKLNDGNHYVHQPENSTTAYVQTARGRVGKRDFVQHINKVT